MILSISNWFDCEIKSSCTLLWNINCPIDVNEKGTFQSWSRQRLQRQTNSLWNNVHWWIMHNPSMNVLTSWALSLHFWSQSSLIKTYWRDPQIICKDLCFSFCPSLGGIILNTLTKRTFYYLFFNVLLNCNWAVASCSSKSHRQGEPLYFESK